MIRRGGNKSNYFPGDAIRVTQPSTYPWWLSGGIATANCIAAYQPKGAASLAASYVNLANPGTYNAAPGVAPTFASATGWTFAGTNWLETSIVASSGWSMIIKFTNTPIVATAYTVIGSLDTVTTRFNITPNTGGGQVGYGSGGALNVAPNLASGILGIAGQTAYRNGVAESTPIPAWSGVNTISVNVGRRNRTVPDTYFIGNIHALAIYNTTISAGQAAALTTAMNAL